jgi:hypothetical protein
MNEKSVCWVLGVGCWVLGVGCWVLGVWEGVIPGRESDPQKTERRYVEAKGRRRRVQQFNSVQDDNDMIYILPIIIRF